MIVFKDVKLNVAKRRRERQCCLLLDISSITSLDSCLFFNVLSCTVHVCPCYSKKKMLTKIANTANFCKHFQFWPYLAS